MTNSLRKKLKRMLIEQELLFIEIYNMSRDVGKIRQMIIGLYIKEEFYRLKYETNYIVIIWSHMEEKAFKLKRFDDYIPEGSYYTNQVEEIDNDYCRSIVDPIFEYLKINPKTYKMPDYLYAKQST